MAPYSVSHCHGLLYAHAASIDSVLCLYDRFSGARALCDAGYPSFYVLCDEGMGKMVGTVPRSCEGSTGTMRAACGRDCRRAPDYRVCLRPSDLSADAGFIAAGALWAVA